MKNFKVNNCHECPFANNDNEYGKVECNLNAAIQVNGYNELPKHSVHELCPLKAGNVTVELAPQIPSEVKEAISGLTEIIKKAIESVVSKPEVKSIMGIVIAEKLLNGFNSAGVTHIDGVKLYHDPKIVLKSDDEFIVLTTRRKIAEMPKSGGVSHNDLIADIASALPL